MAKIVIALGGNALLPPTKSARFQDQVAAIRRTAKILANIAQHHKILITHGNGSQIGNLLLQQHGSRFKKSLDVLGSQTQGEIGYLLQQYIENNLKGKDKFRVITLITQVLVDSRDKSFRRPTKPIGPFYSRSKGRDHKKIDRRGYRLVVPSPRPLELIEKDEILELFKEGYIVIAAGGGGIPVVKTKHGLKGVRAVIDKDRSASLLAKLIRANILVILTDVNGVYTNWGTRKQKLIKKLKVKEAQRMLESGQLQEGSIGPKVEAAIDFVGTNPKRVAVIARLTDIKKALVGKAGTVIHT